MSGAIDAIATDHAPHAGSEKMQEFEQCPFGIIGLETAIGLTLERLVHSGKITLTRMVELFTTGPARVLNLERGRLAVGAPADITILDTERAWTYDVNQLGFQEPQFSLRRPYLPRRPGGHHRQRKSRLDAESGLRCARGPRRTP